MIEATEVSYKIGRHLLLDQVSLAVPPGKLVSVVGPNGAGKSTLLRLLSGELQPSSGQVTLMQRPLAHWSRKENAQRRAVLSQRISLTFSFSVLEVVLMGRTPHNNGYEREEDWQIAYEALERVGLTDLAERPYTTLSGGEQQRVQMARVMAQIWTTPAEGHRYLLLDEPTNSLDLTYQHSILKLARQFADDGTAVLAILHDLNLAAQYSDHILMLKNGQLQCQGTPDEVITADRVLKVFDLPVQIVSHPQKGFPFMMPLAQ